MFGYSKAAIDEFVVLRSLKRLLVKDPHSGPPVTAATTKAKDKVHAVILITIASHVNCASH